MPKTMMLPLATMLAMIVLAGCSATAGNPRQDAPEPTELNVQFDVENAEGNSTTMFADGDTAIFVIRVRNNSSVPLPLRYTWPPQRFRVTAPGAEGVVWEAFSGRMFPQVMRNHDIAPGETAEFSADWNLMAEGRRVSPGEYRVTPEFIAFRSGQRLTPTLHPIDITVVE